MSVQVEPYQLRFLASRFSAGAQEIRLRANRLENIMNDLVQGSWKGEGAHAFAVKCEAMKSEMQKTADVLDGAIQTLNRFASQMERVNQLRQQANMLEQQSWQYGGDSIDDLHHRQNLARQAAQIRQEAEWEANAADAQAANEFNTIMSMIPQLMEQVSQYMGSNSKTGELDELPEPLRSYYLRHRDLLQDDEGETAATLTMGSFKEADYEGVASLENRHDALVKQAREILRIKNVEGYITDPDEIEQIVDQSFQMECGDLSDEDLEIFIQRNSESMQLAERMQNERHQGIDITKDPEYFAFARMMGGYEPTGFNPDGVVGMVRGRVFGTNRGIELPNEYEGINSGYYDSESLESEIRSHIEKGSLIKWSCDKLNSLMERIDQAPVSQMEKANLKREVIRGAGFTNFDWRDTRADVFAFSNQKVEFEDSGENTTLFRRGREGEPESKYGLGAWWGDKSRSIEETRDELAVLENWGNPLDTEYKIQLPKGIRMLRGTAAPQSIRDEEDNQIIESREGGAPQYWINSVDASWITEINKGTGK